MKDRDAFSAFHPAVLCGYYALVLVFSMFLTHPLCLAASLLGALSYAAKLRGGRAVLRSLAWMAPVWLLAAAVNTLFNHEGATILTYFSSGNPLTLESMLYGLSAGGMLAAVLLWFTTYQAVMTSDKFVYLFGRAIPALSLVLSMTLRFVPKFRAQLRAVQQARQFAGNSEKTGPIQKVRTSVENFSILVTWSLENAVLWLHGCSKMPLKRRIPCARAVTACRAGRRFRFFALNRATHGCWHGCWPAADL